MLRGHLLYPTVAYRYVDDIGVAGTTRRNYLKAFKAFQASLPADTRMAEITATQARTFIERKADGTARADASRAGYLSIIGGIFTWAMDPDVDVALTVNPVARLQAQARNRGHATHRPVRRKTWLSAERAKAFVATVRGDGSDACRVRDAFVIAMYLYTGVRCSELINVAWRDVDFAAGQCGEITVTRKGGKRGQVALGMNAQRLLFEWRSKMVEAVGPDIDDLRIVPQVRTVFVDAAGAPAGLTPALRPHYLPADQPWDKVRLQTICWRRGCRSSDNILKMVAKRAAECDLHVRPHDLRRSFAGIMEDVGADIREIQKALGHNNVTTTERYLEKRTKLSAAVNALDFG